MKLKRFFASLLVLAGVILTLSSCEKDIESTVIKQEKFITLGEESVTLLPGETLVLRPRFDTNPTRQYIWTVENQDILSLEVNADSSATIVALKNGTSTISLSSHDGEVNATCKVIIDDGSAAADDGVIKILAIGNSFSEDALESYLYELAEQKDIPIVIGNLYIGGASLELHWSNASANKAAYQYRKIALNGIKTNTDGISIATALADDDWDYVSLQQASPNSGQFNTFTTPLPLLANYVKNEATNKKLKLIIHQTWAYAQNSSHDGFANYDRDQLKMYHAIVDAVGQAKSLIQADLLVPAGTAIQNGRTSLIGDNFTRDGYHLDLNIGRYTAACTWFEMLTGVSIIGNQFKPDVLTDFEAEIAQHAAHMAIERPSEITPLLEYQDGGGSGDLNAPVFVGFGFNSALRGWNGFLGANNYTAGKTIENLKDDKDNYTGVSMTIVEGFNGRNANGEKTTTTNMDLPTEVSSYSYFGNSKAIFSGQLIEQSVLKIKGLNSEKSYDFCFFGSRSGVGSGENRETKYVVSGKNEEVALLDAANNTDKTACASGVKPSENGEITILITSGDNNTNSTGFFYINAVRIESAKY